MKKINCFGESGLAKEEMREVEKFFTRYSYSSKGRKLQELYGTTSS